MLRVKLTYIFGLLTIFLVALACNTSKRIQKAEAFLAKEGKLSEICASRFPLKDSIAYRDSVRFDTLYEGIYSIDTIFDKDTIKVYVTLPAKVITKEVIKYRDVYRESTAKVAECEKRNRELTNAVLSCENDRVKLLKDVDEWKSVAKKRWWFLWILLVIALGITFRKNIFNVSKKFIGFPLW